METTTTCLSVLSYLRAQVAGGSVCMETTTPCLSVITTCTRRMQEALFGDHNSLPKCPNYLRVQVAGGSVRRPQLPA